MYDFKGAEKYVKQIECNVGALEKCTISKVSENRTNTHAQKVYIHVEALLDKT